MVAEELLEERVVELATGPRGSPTPRGRLLEEPARAPSTGRFVSCVELAEVVRRSAITVFFAFALVQDENSAMFFVLARDFTRM